MDINNFEFHPRQINRQVWETVIVDKESKNRFGCNYQSNGPAPHEAIFEEFKKNKNQFFIDVESQIIKDEPKVEQIIVTPAPEIMPEIKTA